MLMKSLNWRRKRKQTMLSFLAQSQSAQLLSPSPPPFSFDSKITPIADTSQVLDHCHMASLLFAPHMLEANLRQLLYQQVNELKNNFLNLIQRSNYYFSIQGHYDKSAGVTWPQMCEGQKEGISGDRGPRPGRYLVTAATSLDLARV